MGNNETASQPAVGPLGGKNNPLASEGKVGNGTGATVGQSQRGRLGSQATSAGVPMTKTTTSVTSSVASSVVGQQQPHASVAAFSTASRLRREPLGAGSLGGPGLDLAISTKYEEEDDDEDDEEEDSESEDMVRIEIPSCTCMHV